MSRELNADPAVEEPGVEEPGIEQPAVDEPPVDEDIVEEDAVEVPAATPRARSSPFRRRTARVPMDADAAARQGRAAMLAFEKLGNGAAVREFLNTHDEALGGRPIDLAVEGADGLASVEAAIAGMTRPAKASAQ